MASIVPRSHLLRAVGKVVMLQIVVSGAAELRLPIL